ncbi:MAG TPA: hypothetical protein PLB89_02100 [Flavobacteriales bacterium]|nr:hypothetical protein [Flavobacteriales bacterium]
MWIVLEFVVVAAIVLFAVTEFFYPLLAGKPLFGSFRRKTAASRPQTLDEALAEAKRKAAEVKDVQHRTEEELRAAERRRNAADDLLK